jgi:hypothetical protein
MGILNKHDFKLTLLRYIIPLIACLGLLSWSLKLYNADLRIPFAYEGDALLFYAWTKTIIETGWVFNNSLIGAPYGLELYDFPFNNTLDVLLIKIISLFSSNAILVENLFYLLTFPLTTLTSMIVFRHFKIDYAYSLLGSLLFTFMPYHFLRGVSHLNLSSYFMVPLMAMVILWIFSDELHLFKSNDDLRAKSLLSDYKLIASMLICVLSGIVYFYYSYFFCLFLFIAGVSSSISTRKKAPLITSILLILLVFAVVVLNQSPSIMYQYQNGNNPEVAIRSPAETEIYGLKITQLLLPINGHRIPAFAKLKHLYGITAPLVNENYTASLGIICSLGFLFLIGFILFGNFIASSKSEYYLAILSRLSVLNLSAVLFATIGGFSSLNAYILLAQFRAVNRISIFIAFFSIFAVLIILKYISNKYIKNARSNELIYIIACFLLLVGMFDQTSDFFVPSYASIKEEYLIDENFVNSIDAIMPENSMIFQMPNVPFPESAPIYKMIDYTHLRGGYLHSKDLRWSYGAMKGRTGGNWQRLVAGMSIDDMIKTLSQFGFSGIYVDSYGYKDGGAKLLSNIMQILEVRPIVSDNKRLYFFDMTKYSQQTKINPSENKNSLVEFDSGWNGLEDWSGILSSWMQADATISTILSDNRTAYLSLNARSFYRNRTLEIYSGDALTAQAVVPTWFINLSVPMHLAKGKNTVRLHVPEGCESPSDIMDLNSADSRCLSIAVQNITISWA